MPRLSSGVGGSGSTTSSLQQPKPGGGGSAIEHLPPSTHHFGFGANTQPPPQQNHAPPPQRHAPPPTSSWTYGANGKNNGNRVPTTNPQITESFLYDSEEDAMSIKPFDIRDIVQRNLPTSFLIMGMPQRGKTTVVKNILWWLSERLNCPPFIYTKTVDTFKLIEDLVPLDFIEIGIDPEYIKLSVQVFETVQEAGRPRQWAIVIDDIFTDEQDSRQGRKYLNDLAARMHRSNGFLIVTVHKESNIWGSAKKLFGIRIQLGEDEESVRDFWQTNLMAKFPDFNDFYNNFYMRVTRKGTPGIGFVLCPAEKTQPVFSPNGETQPAESGTVMRVWKTDFDLGGFSIGSEDYYVDYYRFAPPSRFFNEDGTFTRVRINGKVITAMSLSDMQQRADEGEDENASPYVTQRTQNKKKPGKAVHIDRSLLL